MHLYEKKLVISLAAKPEVEENIVVSISVFFFNGFSLVKNLRDANNYRYTKAAACCLRPYAFNTQVGITEWSEDFFHGSTKGHFIQAFKVL